MSDLFVSYASEDREHVVKLVEAFESQGWTVWWDRHIHTGASFDRNIEEALDSAKCVVVVWSNASLDSDWVRAEATEGLERNILVPLPLDDVRPPLLFRQKQAISLLEWKSRSHQTDALIDLLPSIQTILEGYAGSRIPVSTQRSWALGRVFNSTRHEMFSGVAYQVLSLGMSYFENAFLYTAERDGSQADQLSIPQLEALVEEEGLDGYIVGDLSTTSDNAIKIELRVTERNREATVRAALVNEPDKLIVALVELLVEVAELIQGRSLKDADRLRAYMAGLSLEGLYWFSQSFESAARYDYSKTKAQCERALSLCGDFIPAYRGLAVACLYLGQYSEARKAMARAMRGMDHESDRNRHFARGVYYAVFREDHEKAATEFEAIMQESPLDASAINNLAVCRFYQLRFLDATELAERDLQLYPGKTLGLQNAAFYAMYAGDFSKAGGLALQVSANEPAFVRAYVIQALVKAEAGMTKEAKEIIQEALRGKPEVDSILLQGLADLELSRGDLDSAVGLLERGMACDREMKNQELLANKLLMRLECDFLREQVSPRELPIRIDAVLQLSDSVPCIATIKMRTARQSR